MPSDSLGFLMGDSAPAPSGAHSSGLYAPVTQDEINAAATAAGVDPDFYGRILAQERGVRQSPKGAIGPAQIMQPTADLLKIDPYDRQQNLLGGAKYLKQMLDTFHGDQSLAAAGYNAGPGAVVKAGGIPDYPETKAYVAGVMGAGGDPHLAAIMGDAPAVVAAAPETVPAAASGEAVSPEDAAYLHHLNPGVAAVPPGVPAQGAAVYDPGANVMRDPTGRVVALGNASTEGALQVFPQGETVVDPRTKEVYARNPANPLQFVNKAGRPYEIAQPANTNPADVQAWLAAHPNDPGNKPFNPAILPGQSPLDRVGVGVAQGLGNVGATIDNAQLWADRNIPGMNALNSLFEPSGSDATAVSNDIVNRLQNDYQYRNSPMYGVGKFAGEAAPAVLGTVMTEGLGGEALAPLLDANPALRPAAQFLAGSGEGPLLARVPSLALGGARQGATAAGITSGGSSEPLSNQLAGGALTGAALSPLGSAIASGASKLATKTGDAVSQPIADIANRAQDYGINIPAPLIAAAQERAAGVRNGPLAIAHSELLKAPGSGYSPAVQQARSDWTQAVSRTIGLDTPHITPEAADQAFDTIGNAIDSVGGRTGVASDAVPPLMSRLDQIGKDAREMGMDQSQLNALDLHIAKVKDAIKANGGQIPGPTYLNLTQSNSTLSKVAKSDHTAFGDSAGDILDALHEGVQASATPEDVAALQAARFQYKNLKTLQPLIDKAKDTGGVLNPMLLSSRVSQKFGNSYTRGKAGPLGDLAPVGRLLGDQTSDSGTPGRLADMLKVAAGGGAATLDAAAAMTGHLPEALTAAGLAGAAAAGRYGANALRGARALSPAYRASLLGQPLPPSPFTPQVNRLFGPTVVPASAVGFNMLTQPQPAQ